MRSIDIDGPAPGQAPARPLAPGLRAERLAREAAKARRVRAAEGGGVRSLASVPGLVSAALTVSGLRGPGLRNARRVHTMRRRLALPGLPEAFAGLRVLHLSDPHFGADTGIDEAIVACAGGVEHDLCVMTGDYRNRSSGPIDQAMRWTARLRDALGGEPIAVLGNHDSIEMLEPMRAMGIDVLMNGCRTLRRGDAALHVAGVDDPRYYRLDDLDAALAARERDGVAAEATLLLAHSPELAERAAAAGCDAYLCGHTHGGQICLPGGVPVLRNTRAPRERLDGAWRVGAMRGYTSRGTGVSIVPARFHCPPEVTLHVLERAEGDVR